MEKKWPKQETIAVNSKKMAVQYGALYVFFVDGNNRRQLLCVRFKRKIVGPLDCFQALEDVKWESYLHPIGKKFPFI